MIIPHPAPSGVRLLCMSFTSNGEVAPRVCSGVRCGAGRRILPSGEAVDSLGKSQSTPLSNRTGTVYAIVLGSRPEIRRACPSHSV